MTNDLAQLEPDKIMEQVIAKGDLSSLTAGQRVTYYNTVCESLGLNRYTNPLSYITLSGKLTLYAKRDAADQLRKLHGVSLQVLSEKYDRGMYSVHVRATDKSGRTDEDFGVVPYGEKMAPDFAANMRLKAITKAKRRVTLSICGLGYLDETEVEDIPKDEATPLEHEPQESAPQADHWEVALERASRKGVKALEEIWEAMPREDKKRLADRKDEYKQAIKDRDAQA